MKPNLILCFLLAAFMMAGCSKPIANSLLSSGAVSDDTTTGSTDDDTGDLDIQPDNPDMAVFVDNSDTVEITGTCKDLNRKKNRILVEVFTGDDETIDPYISNAISDRCQNTASGVPTTERCFWVTKGLGLTEDSGLVTQRDFPQCHDGKFGFTIKLGKILQGPTLNAPLQKYTVRMKLRTLEGILSDTPWSRVSIARDMQMPTIDTMEADNTLFGCSMTTSPARFNQNIRYTLSRNYLDAKGNSMDPSVPAAMAMYSGKISDLISTTDSAYGWRNDNLINTHAPVVPVSSFLVMAGVKYTYNFTATDSTPGYYPGPLPAPSKTGGAATCELPPPTIDATAAPFKDASNNYYCYVGIVSTFDLTSVNNNLIKHTWAYSTIPSWTGANGDGIPLGTPPFSSTPGLIRCDTSTGLPSAVCTLTGIAGATTYYIAVREESLVGPTQIGKWSNIVACRTP